MSERKKASPEERMARQQAALDDAVVCPMCATVALFACPKCGERFYDYTQSLAHSGQHNGLVRGAGSGAPSEPSDAAIGAAFEYLESENGCDLPEVVGRECMREILSAAYAVDGLRGAPADAAPDGPWEMYFERTATETGWRIRAVGHRAKWLPDATEAEAIAVRDALNRVARAASPVPKTESK